MDVVEWLLAGDPAVAWQTRRVGRIFKQAFGPDRAHQVLPVYEVHSASQPWAAEYGLKFLEQKYGPPSDDLWGVAATGYFNLWEGKPGDPKAPPAVDVPYGLWSPAHDELRTEVREWVEAHVAPGVEEWEATGTLPRDLFAAAGAAGLFGWKMSPLFYAGYCYVEAARQEARIEVGDRTEFNNNLMIKSEGAGIRIGRDGLFGAHVEIFDSNFHHLDPARRRAGGQAMAPVEIGDNVFVGMGVKILKGVTIGADAVVGAGAVVSSSLPAGVIAAGNPAKVIREL
ncbi:MAG: acyl-CoA dehydrogenase family protein [Actinobacteria bacterium]|nr:acyl-CoA dehydrogenase family protein [Actinomycetota bacterium]